MVNQLAPIEETTLSLETSLGLYERARRVLPGGTTRGSVFYEPYPAYASSGRGCELTLEDGPVLIDFMNNFTSLVLGHQHPAIMEAARKQLGRGNSFGAPIELEISLAERLVNRIPSIDQVIFTSSGSEAIMAGLRVARVATGRDGIAKFEGGYHGGHDYMKVSGMSTPQTWGDDPILPRAVADTGGISDAVVADVHVMQFNSIESVTHVLERHHGDIAVLIMEPVLGVGGLIPATTEFLATVRELCDRYGIVLFFDEVITQRLSLGGAQELFGVTPDLTVVSKVMGSGFPIGALGGKRDLMAVLDPTQANGPAVYHSGTYNANPLSVAAAVATMEAIDADVIAHINAIGEAARTGLEQVIQQHGIPASVTGVGSLFNIHFSAEAPKTYRSAKTADANALRRFHRGMLTQGIFLATRGLGCASYPMRDEHVDALLDAADRVLERVDTTSVSEKEDR